MVTARLLTNCSNTLRNIHTNAREYHKDVCKTEGGLLLRGPLYIYITDNNKAMNSQVMWMNIVLCFIYLKLYYI